MKNLTGNHQRKQLRKEVKKWEDIEQASQVRNSRKKLVGQAQINIIIILIIIKRGK